MRLQRKSPWSGVAELFSEDLGGELGVASLKLHISLIGFGSWVDSY